MNDGLANVPNEGWCYSCGDLVSSANEAPIVTRLRDRAEEAERTLAEVADALDQHGGWYSGPLLHRTLKAILVGASRD